MTLGVGFHRNAGFQAENPMTGKMLILHLADGIDVALSFFDDASYTL